MSLPPPSYNDDKRSFAHPTVHKRWPTIIEGAIDDVNAQNRPSGEVIVAKLKQLLGDFQSDQPVAKFTAAQRQLDPSCEFYNSHYDELDAVRKITWLTGPWLYLECHLYQLIHVFFLELDDAFWHTFDVFEGLKNKTFQQSQFGVLELCKRLQLLDSQLSKVDADTLELLFREFVDISLWGNATDLSLLAGNVTLEDIKSVQGAEVRKKNEEKILVNDLDSVWRHLTKSSGEKAVDFVLDNSGFELFADLSLALFLLDSKLVSKINIHCKEIPWFVSDTMPKDFELLLKQLDDVEFYSEIHGNPQDKQAIEYVSAKIRAHHSSGSIVITHNPFWTLSYNFWDIPKFTDLYEQLQQSSLIIFKGDLNYRKLTGDLQWDKTTPFKTAIQDLATSGLPVLSLRTCKADVVVGLPEGVNERLIQEWEAAGNAIGEFWTSSGKWAVISFNA